MKRLFCLFIALGFIFSVCACGQVKKLTAPGQVKKATGYNPASGKVKPKKNKLIAQLPIAALLVNIAYFTDFRKDFTLRTPSTLFA